MAAVLLWVARKLGVPCTLKPAGLRRMLRRLAASLRILGIALFACVNATSCAPRYTTALKDAFAAHAWTDARVAGAYSEDAVAAPMDTLAAFEEWEAREWGDALKCSEDAALALGWLIRFEELGRDGVLCSRTRVEAHRFASCLQKMHKALTQRGLSVPEWVTMASEYAVDSSC